MTSRYPNPNLAKLHRNDTIVEASKVPGIEAVSDKRSLLSRGNVRRALLITGRTENRTICPPGHINCPRWMHRHPARRPERLGRR